MIVGPPPDDAELSDGTGQGDGVTDSSGSGRSYARPAVPSSRVWTVPAALTPQMREQLRKSLDPTFTDEDRSRGRWFAPDVRIVVIPDPDGQAQFRIVAHWLPPSDLPPTSVDLVVDEVRETVERRTGLLIGVPDVVDNTNS